MCKFPCHWQSILYCVANCSLESDDSGQNVEVVSHSNKIVSIAACKTDGNNFLITIVTFYARDVIEHVCV